MRVIEGAVLGLVQGLTEFLPISSSAHLRVVPEILGWDDPGASFTAVVQLGTALAVVLAFRAELGLIARSMLSGPTQPGDGTGLGRRLFRQLVIGTVPIVVVGALASSLIEGPLRNLVVVAVALILGTIWLWSASARPGSHRVADALDRDAALIGVAQVAALVPGVSRSGATIGAALKLGFSPEAAARYSFLLSIPAVVLAGLFGLRDVNASLELLPTLVGLVVAFASGWLSLRWLLRLVASGRLGGLLLYRLAFAAVVLTVAAR